MASSDHGEPRSSPAATAASWGGTLVLGVLTIILGVIVSLHPSGSLNVLAVMLGVLMILSGIFHLIRVFDASEQHRFWFAVGGLLFIVIGVVLIRHLNLTIAVIGISWIVQGLTGLITRISGDVRDGRGWRIAFGVISLIAGSWWRLPLSPRSTSWPSCSGSCSSSWASSRSSAGSCSGTTATPWSQLTRDGAAAGHRPARPVNLAQIEVEANGCGH